MFDRFTQRSRTVVELAREEAGRMGDSSIGTEHLLLGLLREGQGVAVGVLSNLGINLSNLRLGVEGRITSGGNACSVGDVSFTPSAKRALEHSVEEAKILSHNYIGTEHLLLGLVKERTGAAAKVLHQFGVRLETVRMATPIVLKCWTPPGGTLR